MKKVPIRRRKGFKRGYEQNLKRKPLKKVSRSQARRLAKYYPIRNEFLSENPFCAICLLRDRERPNESTEVHHSRGRAGELLFDARFFVASCRDCRSYPHDNPAWAREMGILAAVGDWNRRAA